MSDPHFAAAQRRSQIAADWAAAHAGEVPPMVRQFLYQDVPALFAALHAERVHNDHHWTPQDRLAEEIRAERHVAELVHLVRLADDAGGDGNDPLWRARESDIDEAIRRLCVHRLRLLVDHFARELSMTTWTGNPDVGGGRQVGPIALEWRDDR